MIPLIFHIDFDSFFASCEQQWNPLFRNKPLGVTAANGRTAIIAASREAKARGVKSPSRTFEAEQICPDILLTTSHFDKYWEISKQFLTICTDYSPFVEIFSLDEVFIDMTKTAHLFGGSEQVIKAIKKRIKKEIGEYITVSIGISYNKLLAKLASGLKKPNGVVEITRDNFDSLYTQAKLTDICGIGSRIKDRLLTIGVITLLDLQTIPLYLLKQEFGTVEAEFLKQVGLGLDTTPVIPYTNAPEVKSVGRNYCLPGNEYKESVVLQNLFELCEEVGIKLRRLGKKAKTIGFSLRGSVDIHGRKTYSYYCNLGKDIFSTALNCIRTDPRYTTSLLASTDYIRQISVWVSNLEDAQCIPSNFLFDSEKKLKLTRAIDSLNERFGDHTIRNGFLLYADKLTTVPNGFMADRYERTKLASL